MHDFIQSQSFSTTRNPFASRAAVPGWVQRGLMRSFGEDDVPAPYRSSPQQPDRSRRRNKGAPRSAILPSAQ
jgi:hypothetical protein